MSSLPGFLSFGLTLLFSIFFGVPVSFAARKKAIVVQPPPKRAPFWKRLLLGSSARGVFKDWKVGDSRLDNALVVNVAVVMITMTFFVVLGTLVQRAETARELKAIENETLRLAEYKEVSNTSSDTSVT